MGFEQRTTKAPAAEELTKQMKETLEQTKKNIEKAKARMKRQADKYRSQAPDYEIGNKVWLSTENLKLTRTSKKLTEQWLGPYDITKRIGDNTIELRLPRSMKIHPVVKISRVKPYKEHLEGQPTFKPGPVQVTEDWEIEFEVESIIDSRWKEHRLEYLVHWKGYSDEDRTWEPKGNLTNVSEAIKDLSLMLPKHLICCRPTSILCSLIVVNQYQRLIKPTFPLIGLMLIKPWGVPGQKTHLSTAIYSLNTQLSLAPTICLQLTMISDFAHYSMLVLYGLISYGIICSPTMPTILSLWTNMLLFIFMMSLLFTIWSISRFQWRSP